MNWCNWIFPLQYSYQCCQSIWKVSKRCGTSQHPFLWLQSASHPYIGYNTQIQSSSLLIHPASDSIIVHSASKAKLTHHPAHRIMSNVRSNTPVRKLYCLTTTVSKIHNHMAYFSTYTFHLMSQFTELAQPARQTTAL